jgi:hypothetical protein
MGYRMKRILGVLFTQYLKWTGHCQHEYSKANRMLGMTSRMISFEPKEILLTLYEPLVQPMLEYCAPARHPHYHKDVDMIERV